MCMRCTFLDIFWSKLDIQGSHWINSIFQIKERISESNNFVSDQNPKDTITDFFDISEKFANSLKPIELGLVRLMSEKEAQKNQK